MIRKKAICIAKVSWNSTEVPIGQVCEYGRYGEDNYNGRRNWRYDHDILGLWWNSGQCSVRKTTLEECFHLIEDDMTDKELFLLGLKLGVTIKQ